MCNIRLLAGTTFAGLGFAWFHVSNDVIIRRNGLNRMGRFHVHLGQMINNRPAGMGHGSEVAVAIGGDQYETEGRRFSKSANGATLAEGFDGLIPKTYISKVYQLRGGDITYTRPGGWIEEEGREEEEEERKRPPSVGSSISTHR